MVFKNSKSTAVAALLAVVAGFPIPTLSAATPEPARLAMTVAKRGGDTDLYTMRVDGSERRLIRSDAVGGNRVAWSPDGREILFIRRHTSDPYEPWVVDATGQHLRQLTPQGQSSDRLGTPAWAPDGKRIAYHTSGTFNTGVVPEPNGSIWQIDADGTHAKQLTNPALMGAAFPSWSPDGGRLTFSGYRNSDSDSQIFVMNADGSNVVSITTDFGGDKFLPAWSADGKKIAFVFAPDEPIGSPGQYTSGDHPRWQIAVMDADGGRMRTLTPAGQNEPFLYCPAWTPEGSLVFSSWAPGKPNQRDFGTYRLEMINADGSGRRVILDSGEEPVLAAVAPIDTLQGRANLPTRVSGNAGAEKQSSGAASKARPRSPTALRVPDTASSSGYVTATAPDTGVAQTAALAGPTGARATGRPSFSLVTVLALLGLLALLAMACVWSRNASVVRTDS